MKSSELVTELARKLGFPEKKAKQLLEELVTIISDQLQKSNVVVLHNFGVLEVKKRNERISFNPTLGKRMLIPPKLVVGYKPSATLKEKIKDY